MKKKIPCAGTLGLLPCCGEPVKFNTLSGKMLKLYSATGHAVKKRIPCAGTLLLMPGSGERSEKENSLCWDTVAFVTLLKLGAVEIVPRYRACSEKENSLCWDTVAYARWGGAQ